MVRKVMVKDFTYMKENNALCTRLHSHLSYSFSFFYSLSRLQSSALLKRVIPLADRVLVKRLVPSTKVIVILNVCKLPSSMFCVFSLMNANPNPNAIHLSQTAGGIILPETKVGKSNQGEVLAVGPGYKTRDGDLVAVSVNVGDQVLLPEYGGLPLKLDSEEEEVFLFRNDEILAKLSA